MHAFTAPGGDPAGRPPVPADELPPHGEGRRRRDHQLGEPAWRGQRYLDVDPAKLRLIPEAVDHELFRPGDRDEAAGHVRGRYGVTKPFVLFVSSLWPYKNCEGLIRAFARGQARAGRPPARRRRARARRGVRSGAACAGRASSGIADDVVWVGGVPLEETVHFYRAADVFVYPSFNETFGLPILEAMATGCPVVTSDTSAMPETAGGCALLADPHDPESIADAVVKACGPEGTGSARRASTGPASSPGRATAEQTLEVYREVHARHGGRSLR